MKTANYNIRIDPKVKAEAEEIFSGLGLKLSDAINVFLHKSIMHYGFPFEVRQRKFSTELLEAMEETEQLIKDIESGKRKSETYANARELFAAMDLEDEAEGYEDE
jgi:DNA-damage-inducible protein J